ncbi:MAG TPA: hypothetical protein VGI95_12805 [Caulobacteraceae bacterium]|jgi:hypothetical protein
MAAVGVDAFFICLGISSIIIALAMARAAPDALAMIERITLQSRAPAPRVAPPTDWPPGDPPWGRRD